MGLTDYDTECIALVKTLIDGHPDQHFPIAALATRAGIGATKLKRGFRQLYGMGLYQYLRHRRMELAAQLLGTRSKTLKQIARQCGYRHATNFNTAFKRHYGTTPQLYRVSLLK